VREKFFSRVRVCRPLRSLACVLSACNNLSPSASSKSTNSVTLKGIFATPVVTQTDHLLEDASVRTACRWAMQRAIGASCYRIGAFPKLICLVASRPPNDHTTLVPPLLCTSKTLLLTTRVQLVLPMSSARAARIPYKPFLPPPLFRTRPNPTAPCLRQLSPSRTAWSKGRD